MGQAIWALLGLAVLQPLLVPPHRALRQHEQRARADAAAQDHPAGQAGWLVEI